MIQIFTAPEEPLQGGEVTETVTDGDIAFENVLFAYGDNEVLHGASAP